MRRVRITGWGAMPPPVHGSSVVNQISLRAIQRGESVHWIRPSPADELASLGRWRGRAIATAVTAWMRLVRRLVTARRSDTVYISPAISGLGGVRDLVAWLLASVGRWKVVVHLHTGAVESLLPKPIERLARPAVARTHCLVLLDEHARGRSIRSAREVRVVHNGVTCTADSHDIRALETGPKPLRAVFVSNLYVSKGVLEAAEGFRLLAERGNEEWLFAFAGASAADAVAERLAALRAALPSRVQLLGAVNADERCRLLSDSAVLVFPAQNPLEGSPLVILEALEHGVLPLVSNVPGLVGTAGPMGQVAGSPVEIADALARFGHLPAERRFELMLECHRYWASGWTQRDYEIRLLDALGLRQTS